MVEVLKTYIMYNKDVNVELFNILDNINKDFIYKESGSYFKSISGILNHIIICDILYIKRFKESLNLKIINEVNTDYDIKNIKFILFKDYNKLKEKTLEIDMFFLNFINTITIEELNNKISYTSSKTGKKISFNLDFLLFHLFNHHTHHRGQISQILDYFNIDNDYSNLSSKYKGFIYE